jgi:cyclopropane fatty-acyl-phospholipid synthase-like methyltransferase
MAFSAGVDGAAFNSMEQTLGWDSVWEDVFKSRGWNHYPSEQVIRFVRRNFPGGRAKNEIRVLELGCGEGNNVWFLAREGYSAFGVDGSSTAITRAEQRLKLEGVAATVRVGDAANVANLFPGVQFDAVIDAGCLQCNKTAVIESAVEQIRKMLPPGGKFFSTMIASGSYGEQLGDLVEPGTVTNIRDGGFKGLGLMHFISLEEVQKLFSRFSNVEINFMTVALENRTQEYKHWVITAVV